MSKGKARQLHRMKMRPCMLKGLISYEAICFKYGRLDILLMPP